MRVIARASGQLEAAKNLHEIARLFPNEIRAGLGTVGISLKGKIVRAMKSGQTPTGSMAPLHPLTLLFRRLARKHGSGNAKGFGGKLQNAVRYKIQGSGTETKISIGFIDGDPAQAASKTMAPWTRSLSAAQRRIWHIRAGEGRKAGNGRLAQAIEDWLAAGSTKTKPERAYIQPFVQDQATKDNMLRVVKGRIYSIIEKGK